MRAALPVVGVVSWAVFLLCLLRGFREACAAPFRALARRARSRRRAALDAWDLERDLRLIERIDAYELPRREAIVEARWPGARAEP